MTLAECCTHPAWPQFAAFMEAYYPWMGEGEGWHPLWQCFLCGWQAGRKACEE